MGNQQGSSKSRGYDALSTSGSDVNDQSLTYDQHQARLKALEASSRPHKTRNAEEQKKKRWETYDNLSKKASESAAAPATYGSGKPVSSASSSSSSSSFASSSVSASASSSSTASRLPSSSSSSKQSSSASRVTQDEAREKRIANIQNRLDSKSTRHVAKNNREKQWEAYKSFDAPERSSVPRLKASIASGDNLSSSASSASASAPSAPYEEAKHLAIPGTQTLHTGPVSGSSLASPSSSAAAAVAAAGSEVGQGRFVDRQTLDTASDLEVALVSISEYSPATIQLLRRILQNLVTAPAGEAGMKYRKVKLDSDKLQQLVVRVEGALAAFMMIGFEKVTLPSPTSGVLEDYLYFPPSQSMELARLVLSRLPAPEK